MESRNRVYSLDIVRIIGSFLIVLHHYQQVTGVSFSYVNFFGGRFNLSSIVQLFFVLSGFLLWPYVKKIMEGMSFAEFYALKAARLLPAVASAAIAYELLLAIYYCITGTYEWGIFNGWISVWGTIIASIGMQAGWGMTDPMINNPTWYVSVLMLSYVVFYFVTYVCKRLKITVAYAYIVVSILGMGILNYRIELPFMNGQSSKGYMGVFLGLLLAKYFQKWKDNFKVTLVMLCITASMIFIACRFYFFVQSDIFYLGNYIIFPAIILLFNSEIVRKLFNASIFAICGKISYGIYVWHLPVLLGMYVVRASGIVSIEFGKQGMVLLYIVCVICVGTLSTYLIEIPLNKMLCKKIQEKMGDYHAGYSE